MLRGPIRSGFRNLAPASESLRSPEPAPRAAPILSRFSEPCSGTEPLQNLAPEPAPEPSPEPCSGVLPGTLLQNLAVESIRRTLRLRSGFRNAGNPSMRNLCRTSRSSGICSDGRSAPELLWNSGITLAPRRNLVGNSPEPAPEPRFRTAAVSPEPARPLRSTMPRPGAGTRRARVDI